MNNNINQIVGYDPNTGQPIYSNNIVNQSTTNKSTNNKKKNKTAYILMFLGLLLIFIGVLGLSNEKEDKSSKSRTLMIYMVGSNLESQSGLATVDLNTIDYEKTSLENINVLLIAGGSRRWKNSYIDEDETSIYKLTSNGFVKDKTQPKQNMGSNQVFTNFLDYVYQNYKTDEYDLIFWNHGGAILGSEYDELYDNDLLTLNEIKEGLNNSKFNKENKLEAIIFRTCLNGTIEVADTLKDYSDYLIASEEITLGYPLDGVFKFINDIKQTDSGYDLGVKFVNTYKDYIENLKQVYKSYTGKEQYIYSTYSVVDLSQVDKLGKAFADFIKDIDVKKDYNTISRVRSNLYQYAYTDASNPEATYDMVDFYNLVNGLKELSPKKAEKVLNIFKKAVVYNYATNSKSMGLSIYFPYNGADNWKTMILKLYTDFNSFNDYRSFITSFNTIQNSSSNSYTFANNNIGIDSTKEEADFQLELTEEQKETFAKASYIVFRDNKDGYYLPVYKSDQVTVNGNMLNANIKDRQLKVVSTLDSSENIITLFEVSNEKDFIKYNSYVTLEDFSSENFSEWKIDSASVSLVYNKNTSDISIGNAVLNSQTEGIPSSVAIDLKDYTHIVFASSKYKILDENGNYDENWESNGVIEGLEEKIENIKFELQDFNDGYDYYCVFKIFDTNNDSYYSKLVKMN